MPAQPEGPVGVVWTERPDAARYRALLSLLFSPLEAPAEPRADLTAREAA